MMHNAPLVSEPGTFRGMVLLLQVCKASRGDHAEPQRALASRTDVQQGGRHTLAGVSAQLRGALADTLALEEALQRPVGSRDATPCWQHCSPSPTSRQECSALPEGGSHAAAEEHSRHEQRRHLQPLHDFYVGRLQVGDVAPQEGLGV